MACAKPALAAAFSLLLAGCATWSLGLAPERADRPWRPPAAMNGTTAGHPNGNDTVSGYVLSANPDLSIMPPSPKIDSQRPYSLTELIEIAASSNPRTRIAWNDARRAALGVGIAKSTYLPRLTLGSVAGYQVSRTRENVSADTPVGDASDGNSNWSAAKGTVSTLSLQWLLFDFGERAAIIDAAKQESIIANIAFTALHQELIHNVSLTFYAYGAARNRLVTAIETRGNAEMVQAAAEDRFEQGIGTAIEVAQAKHMTALADLGVTQARGGVEDSYLALIAAMGISPLTKIRIEDISRRELSPAMMGPVETILAQALARRPDLQSAYAAEKAAVARVRAAEAEFWPKFFVSATGAYNTGDVAIDSLPSIGQQSGTVNISSNQWGGTILAGVTLPLYDGGTRSALLAQARAEAENAASRLAQMRDDAVHQVVLADNALRTSLASHATAQSLVSSGLRLNGTPRKRTSSAAEVDYDDGDDRCGWGWTRPGRTDVPAA